MYKFPYSAVLILCDLYDRDSDMQNYVIQTLLVQQYKNRISIQLTCYTPYEFLKKFPYSAVLILCDLYDRDSDMQNYVIQT